MPCPVRSGRKTRAAACRYKAGHREKSFFAFCKYFHLLFGTRNGEITASAHQNRGFLEVSMFQPSIFACMIAVTPGAEMGTRAPRRYKLFLSTPLPQSRVLDA
jgi:hypothetical protein